MDKKSSISRRGFLKTTAAGAVTLAGGGVNLAFGQASAALRAGLIGCGGRGKGAAGDCVKSSPGVKIVALADAFKDRVDDARRELSRLGKDQADIPPERCFVGLDAYQKLIASDVDLVLMATPPAFRPIHLAEAVKAGKHVFMEKPVAVCPAGVRSVIASAAVADEKKLGIVAGTQRRHQGNYLETMKRIHDGAIGQIVSGQCYWNQGGLWVHGRKEQYSDVEWQMRNWLYFTWLSGDHICEQHVHNLDVINWAFNSPPAMVYGMGGRAARKGKQHGNIYDHFCIEYEYASGARTISQCRQIDGASHRVGERVVGTKGVSDCAGLIADHKGNEIWRYKGSHQNPYVQEHADLIASIRAGKPRNEAKRIAASTMTAVMGRMSAYTGRAFKWDWVMKASKLDLMPKDLKFGPRPAAPVSKPGTTPLV